MYISLGHLKINHVLNLKNLRIKYELYYQLTRVPNYDMNCYNNYTVS